MHVKQFMGTIAATTGLLHTVYHCDCNPSLYFTDLWFQYYDDILQQRRRRQTKRVIIKPPHGQQQQQKSYHHHPFANQCIWIIGASSGIGEELAYQLVSPICRPNHPQRQRNVTQQEQDHHPIQDRKSVV